MARTTSQQHTPQDCDTAAPDTELVWRLHLLASPDRRLAGTVLPLTEGTTDLGREGGIAVDDGLLSRRHLTLTVLGDRVRVEDQGSRNGTFHAGRRIQGAWTSHGAVLRFGRSLAVLEADLQRAREFDPPTVDIPGRSELARVLRGELALASRSPLPVLLVGETGTGKEHAAHDLHRRLHRRGPLVRFNVAAVPHNLFESELFGHVAGAFTGAGAARLGRVREAHGGTLVLDEIGELPEVMQPKLLRMLEEGRVRPVGGNADVAVDVRFVASTNADLHQLMRQGRFRRDLLARLRGNEIHLPPLAERRTDLLDLADAVAPHPDGPWRAHLSVQAAERLLLHPWTDNLRELRAVLLRAHMLAGGAEVGTAHLPAQLGQLPMAQDGEPEWPVQAPTRPSATQLRAWLREHDGNIGAIAKRVGRHRRQVYRWLAYAGLGAPDLEASRTPPDE